MPQLKGLRRELYLTAEALQRVLAIERLTSGVDYVFTGSFSDDGVYKIEITLKATASHHGKKD